MSFFYRYFSVSLFLLSLGFVNDLKSAHEQTSLGLEEKTKQKINLNIQLRNLIEKHPYNPLKIEELLKQGANPNITGQCGWTLFHQLVMLCSTELVELFLKYKADPNFGTYGNTPLHSAASDGLLPVVKLLLQYNAHLNVTDSENWTPLEKATYHNHPEVVKTLLDSKADPNINSPIHLADNPEIALLLLKEGVKINAKNTSNGTPLHEAAMFNNMAIIRLLLLNDADPSAKDHFGLTPLDWSVKNSCFTNCAKIIRLLQAHMPPVRILSRRHSL